jgi:PAS domain S-box-containing protein
MHGPEELFSQYYDDLPHLTWLGAADGSVLYANRVFREYCGPDADPRGFSWVNVIHPDDVEGTLRKWADARQRRTAYRTEFRFRRQDGVHRWFLI